MAACGTEKARECLVQKVIRVIQSRENVGMWLKLGTLARKKR
jgi:hypothetical protein